MKKKKFSKIFKNDAMVKAFDATCAATKVIFPVLQKKAIDSTLTDADLDLLRDTIRTCQANLVWHHKHTTESQLSAESITVLKNNLNIFKTELESLVYIKEEKEKIAKIKAYASSAETSSESLDQSQNNSSADNSQENTTEYTLPLKPSLDTQNISDNH